MDTSMSRTAALIGVVMLAVSLGRAVGDDRPYLDAARKAARWIRASAVQTDKGLVWPAVPPDPATVQSNLYHGTPGVVLFLIEMYRATGNEIYLREAEKGADYLLAVLPTETTPGLYTGYSGIAYILQETYKAGGKKKYHDGFLVGLKRLKDEARAVGRGVQWNEFSDVMSGIAGIGLFLLYAAEETGDSSNVALACRSADRLIELARPAEGGLKWAMSPFIPVLMPNFSHGTAGVAYFLARLHGKTRRSQYLAASLAGAKYLLAVANKTNDGCLIFHDEPDGKDLYYLGWCHGPAGTARLFYQLSRETGKKSWMEWARRSAGSVLGSGIPEKPTPGFWNNVGVCCGSAGVAEFFLELHRLTGDPRYLDFSIRLTKNLLNRATEENGGLKWIQAEHRVRPELLQAQSGLMQGAAGIGLWLLRLDGFYKGRDPSFVLPDSPFGW